MAALTLLVLSCACYAGANEEARKNSTAFLVSANSLTFLKFNNNKLLFYKEIFIWHCYCINPIKKAFYTVFA